MTHGRRSLIKRELKRAAGNLDMVLGHFQKVYDTVDGRNDLISYQLERIAEFALKLQDLIRSFEESI